VLFPFLDAIILAVATSYFLRFGHRNLNAKLKNEFLSNMIIISSIVAMVTFSVFFFINNFNDILVALNIFAFDLQQNIQSVVSALNLPESFKNENSVYPDSFFRSKRLSKKYFSFNSKPVY